MTTSTIIEPEVFTMGSTETLPIGVDVTSWLAPGESPTSPASELRDLITGVVAPSSLSGSPTIAGNVITQVITGLTRGRRYLLLLSFTAGTNKRPTWPLEIRCRF